MPTTKPRISITLDADDLAVLDRYAAASGTPRASMIAAMVHASVPELDRAADLIEQANAAPRRVVQGLVDDLSNATADAMGFLEPFHPTYREVMGRLQNELRLDSATHKRTPQDPEGGPARRGALGDQRPPLARAKPAGKRPQDPHLLTGGSNSTSKGSQKGGRK